MKRIAFAMLMLAGFAAQAQKPVKPNLNKAATAIKENKWAEAKEILEAATTYEKTQNDGKTWYYRGLVYMVIDTTGDAAVKGLAGDKDAFNTALSSFAKADSLGGKSEYFFGDALNLVTKPQQMESWANAHLTKGISKYQDDNDATGSLELLDKTAKIFESQLKTYANDTLTYYLTVVIGQQADKYDVSIAAADKYFSRGGKSKDVYLVLYQIYNSEGPLKSDEKALKVVQDAKKALPNEALFPKIELELLINQGKEAEAKAGLEEAIRKEPNDKLLHFFLGYVNTKLNNIADARKNFEEAVRLDPAYFQANYFLANTYLMDVEAVSTELKNTGNKPSDSKKRSELVQKRVTVSEIAIPYFEKVEKMKAPEKDDEIEVLQKLSLLYYYVADDKNTARVDKKLKALGVSDE